MAAYHTPQIRPFYCPSANPICYTAFLAQEAEGSTYLSYGCWTDTYTRFIYEQATSEQASSDPGSSVGAPASQAASSDPGSSGAGPTSSSPEQSSSSSSSPDDQSSADVQSSLIADGSSSSPGPSTTPTVQFSVPQGGSSATDRNGVQQTGAAGNTGTPSASDTKEGDSNGGKSDDGGSSNVGAIAGGVVGGVVALAAIGAGIAYMIIRKRRQRVEPMREISPGYYTPSTSY
ncbi:uncharacterized protein LTR77_000195 [Saxophila tyrrhenica]|uniref:Syndecan n=1 Tax=Saxophila tyrrhenica TaxID=1690608 RepID=A0AAV9PRU3_9PEZI|nr:hypothetical protein LTR77_000195 [Saxophila tyrrhenica]